MKKLTLFFLFLMTHLLLAQHESKLSQEFGSLKVVKTYNITADIDFRRTDQFGFTDTGSLVAIVDSSLVCYGTDGQIEWDRQVPSLSLHVSPEGEFVLISYPVSSDSGVTELLSSSGEVVWTQPFKGWILWSPQARYLFPHADQDSPLFLRVYDAKTGRLLWQDRSRPLRRIEAVTALSDETLLVVDVEGKLESLVMTTGQSAMKLDISEPLKESLSYVDWYLSTSGEGNYFAVFGRCGLTKRTWIYSFDNNLNLIWSKQANSRVWSKGFSEDGRRLVVGEGNTTKLYNNLTGKLLWQEKDVRFGRPPIVTDDYVALPQRAGTYVFHLARDGTVKNRWMTQSTIQKVGNNLIEIRKGDKNVIVVIVYIAGFI